MIDSTTFVCGHQTSAGGPTEEQTQERPLGELDGAGLQCEPSSTADNHSLPFLDEAVPIGVPTEIDPDLARLSMEVMTTPRLTPERVRYRELAAWTFRKQGWTQWRIGEHLGISQAAVSKILRRVDRRTLLQMERDVKLVKVKQAARIEELYQEAMWGWHRSKDSTERRRERKGRGGPEIVTEVREGTPDPRFLVVALSAMEAERRLWGLEGRAEGSVVNVAVAASSNSSPVVSTAVISTGGGGK